MDNSKKKLIFDWISINCHLKHWILKTTSSLLNLKHINYDDWMIIKSKFNKTCWYFWSFYLSNKQLFKLFWMPIFVSRIYFDFRNWIFYFCLFPFRILFSPICINMYFNHVLWTCLVYLISEILWKDT